MKRDTKKWRRFVTRFRLDPAEVFDYDDSPLRQSPKKRVVWLNRRLRAQLKYAYEHAPAIKDIFDRAGVSPADIRTIKDLEKLPVTTKDDLVKAQRASPPFGRFLTVPFTDLPRICVSPGPIYDAWTKRRIYSLARNTFKYGGPRPGDIVMLSEELNMLPGTGGPDVMRLLGITIVPAGIGQDELQLLVMREVGATGFQGTPSYLMAFIKMAEDAGYDFRRDFKLRWCRPSGERCDTLLRKTLEEDYGLQVTGETYGTTDLGAIVAYECWEKNGMHFNDEDYLIEICDPKTGKQLGPGEKGEIVVTTFDNAYPLVRFGTGDLASYINKPCPCGLTAPRIPAILGKIGDQSPGYVQAQTGQH